MLRKKQFGVLFLNAYLCLSLATNNFEVFCSFYNFFAALKYFLNHVVLFALIIMTVKHMLKISLRSDLFVSLCKNYADIQNFTLHHITMKNFYDELRQ